MSLLPTLETLMRDDKYLRNEKDMKSLTKLKEDINSFLKSKLDAGEIDAYGFERNTATGLPKIIFVGKFVSVEECNKYLCTNVIPILNDMMDNSGISTEDWFDELFMFMAFTEPRVAFIRSTADEYYDKRGINK